jgi:hypothetical protein
LFKQEKMGKNLFASRNYLILFFTSLNFNQYMSFGWQPIMLGLHKNARQRFFFGGKEGLVLEEESVLSADAFLHKGIFRRF